MKNIFVVFVFVFIGNSLSAQTEIEASFDKTVMIVFGAPDVSNHVKSFNVGLKKSIGVKKAENKIVLQALEEIFPETNLFVELNNGALFTYILKYNNRPAKIVYYEKIPLLSTQEPALGKEQDHMPIVEKGVTINSKKPKAEYVQNSFNSMEGDKESKATQMRDYIFDVAEIKYRMNVWCGGIYVNDDNEFIYKINIENNSNSIFEIGLVDMIVVDSKKALRRKVVNEMRLQQINAPLQGAVEAGERISVYLITHHLALEDNKKCIISLWENHPGQRHFSLDLDSEKILNVKKL